MPSEDHEECTTRECPFPDCDWSYESRFPDSYSGELSADFRAEQHYEREHAGRVRIQVTLETEQQLGGRDPKEVREHFLERYEESTHIDVAYVRTEVLEEPSDHRKLENNEQ